MVEEDKDVDNGKLTPRYLCQLVFSLRTFDKSHIAAYIKIDPSVPDVPEAEHNNLQLAATIAEHPSLFKINTPIKVNILRAKLRNHPNQPFVESILRALQVGFWPWANTNPTGEFPVTWDHSHMEPRNVEEQEFIQVYVNGKRILGHVSPPFGSDLLPGMYSTPVHAVPKLHSTNLRLISNMSMGPFAFNSMIKHTNIAGNRLNSLHSLFVNILAFCYEHPKSANVRLVVWKSDVTFAYHLCPMSPC